MKRGKAFFVLLAWTVIMATAVLVQTDEFAILNKYKSLESRIDKARSYYLAENYVQCEKEAAACLETLAEHHGAHFFLSQTFYKREEFDKALEHILSAETGYIHLQAIGEQLKRKKFEKQLDEKLTMTERLEDFNAALQQTVCNKALYQGAVLDTKGKLDKDNNYSESNSLQAAAQVPAEYSYFHGNCLFRLKKYPEAEEQYRTAVRTDPRHTNAYNNLLNLLYMQKRLDEARALLSRAEANQVVIVPGLKKAILNGSGK